MRVERSAVPRSGGVAFAAGVPATLAVVFLVCAVMPASGQVLDRVRETGQIKFGYVTDGRPFVYQNEAGDAEGYVIELCERIAAEVEAQLGLPDLSVEWIPISFDARVRQVREGAVDLMCAPVVPTLARRNEVSFSIPVFPGGNRAVIRRDSSESLRRALAGTPSTQPVWRGSPAAKVLGRTIFAVVSGTTTESWLNARRTMFQIDAEIVTVLDYKSGIEKLLDHRVDVLFGERAAILGAMSKAAHDRLVAPDRLFTREPYALPLPRDDDDFRLVVDGALSELYASEGFGELYARWFREFDDGTLKFFLWNTFPEHARDMPPRLMTSSNGQPSDPRSDLQFAQSIRPVEE